MRTATLTVSLFFVAGLFTAGTLERNTAYKDPVSLWKNARDGSPAVRRTRQNLAHALIIMGSQTGDSRLYWEALSELQVLFQLPDDGTSEMRIVYSEMGMIYYYLNRADDAVRIWKEGLELFPNNAALEGNIAHVLADMSKFDEALAYALSARKNGPLLPEVANTLGVIYLNKGEFLKAAEQFLQFQNLRPEKSMGYLNAALAFAQAGQHKKAYDLAVRYVSLEPDPVERAKAEILMIELKKKTP